MRGALSSAAQRAWRWTPLEKDTFLYFGSAVFAVATAAVAVSVDYREWGQMAAVAYGAAALICGAVVVVARRQGVAPERIRLVRRCVLVGVLCGAVIAPLLCELTWRADGLPGEHAQAEVAVVERAGDRLAAGHSPYLRHPTTVGISPASDSRSIDSDSFFPYLPGMAPFGLLNAVAAPRQLTDARVLLAGFSLLVAAVALAIRSASVGRRGRVLQFFVVLPSGALPMVTGGDDLPVLSLMLLGIVLCARRRPVLAGVCLGLAGTLKFTAWPLLLLLLLSVRDRDGRPARRSYSLAVAAVVVPIVGAGFASGPVAFFDNVVKFPLGLAGVHSPAASPLLGQVLVSVFPHERGLITALMVALGVAIVLWALRRFTPRTPSEVAVFVGAAMLLATVLAPATRFGYLIYPANLFVWAYLVAKVEPATGYSRSETSNKRIETELEVSTAPPPSAGLTAAL